MAQMEKPCPKCGYEGEDRLQYFATAGDLERRIREYLLVQCGRCGHKIGQRPCLDAKKEDS